MTIVPDAPHRAAYELSVAASDRADAVLSEQQCRDFHAGGYLSLPTLATAEEVSWLRVIYERLFDRRVGWNEGNFLDFAGPDDERPALPQILMPSLYEPALRASALHGRCLSIARQLMGSAAEFHFDHALTKPAHGGPFTPWHQDVAFYITYSTHRTITFWVALQEVGRDSGCLRFVPGSNHGPPLKHRHLHDDPRIHALEAIGVDEARAVYCPLPAGGATIHHNMTLHGAGPNISGVARWAYAMGFGPRSPDRVVPREFVWNRVSRTARNARFAQSLVGRERFAYMLRSALVRLRLHEQSRRAHRRRRDCGGPAKASSRCRQRRSRMNRRALAHVGPIASGAASTCAASRSASARRSKAKQISAPCGVRAMVAA